MTRREDFAFPVQSVQAVDRDREIYTSDGEFGMTKRELFAAMSMQGILSAADHFVMQPSSAKLCWCWKQGELNSEQPSTARTSLA